MKFCEDHWDRLRTAIKARGLESLMAPDAETAVAQMAHQVEAEEITATNFDPLMAAHWGIATNVMQTLGRAGGSPLYLLNDETVPEDPVEGRPGSTWPRCPLCYIGLTHELSCRDVKCSLPRVDGYAWMIDQAADDALAKAKALGLR